MQESLQQKVIDILSTYQDPILASPIVGLGWVGQLQPRSGEDLSYRLPLNWGYPLQPSQQQSVCQVILTLLEGAELGVAIEPVWQCVIKSRGSISQGKESMPQVKNMIAIASGKGGVGKSTTATYMALAISSLQVATGILDADIYGPNVPHLLGVAGYEEQPKQKKFSPVIAHGLQSMSIGYLIDTTTPLVWRGPMASGALQQLLRDTLWQNLDCLVVDMPPGTGDIPLTLSKKYPLSGAVIVTTPHPLALEDARRAIEMFVKVQVPILGVIENMSYHRCPHCHKENALFGESSGERLANEYNIPLLAQIPLLPEFGAVYQGVPAVVDGLASAVDVPAWQRTFEPVAQRVLAELSRQKINYSSKFPKVVVESGDA